MVIIILVCGITLAVAVFLTARVKKDLSSELINRVSIQAIKELRDIRGPAADGFESDDKCRLHFKNLISQHIGLEFSDYIDFDLQSVEGKSIAIIHCSRSDAPVFLKHARNEDFFIRSGPASLKLSVSQVLKYLKQG